MVTHGHWQSLSIVLRCLVTEITAGQMVTTAVTAPPTPAALFHAPFTAQCTPVSAAVTVHCVTAPSLRTPQTHAPPTGTVRSSLSTARAAPRGERQPAQRLNVARRAPLPPLSLTPTGRLAAPPRPAPPRPPTHKPRRSLQRPWLPRDRDARNRLGDWSELGVDSWAYRRYYFWFSIYRGAETTLKLGEMSPGVQDNPYPKLKTPRICPTIFGKTKVHVQNQIKIKMNGIDSRKLGGGAPTASKL